MHKVLSWPRTDQVSFPGLPAIQFLSACSMQNRERKLVLFIMRVISTKSSPEIKRYLGMACHIPPLIKASCL